MFPIEAIKIAQVYSLAADDLLALADVILENTEYKEIRNRIVVEIVYNYIYEKSHVPSLRVSWEDLTIQLKLLINEYDPYESFDDIDLLFGAMESLNTEVMRMFKLLDFSLWGMYLVQVNGSDIEVSYVGDYRIIKWSQSDDATSFRETLPPKTIYADAKQSFRPK